MSDSRYYDALTVLRQALAWQIELQGEIPPTSADTSATQERTSTEVERPVSESTPEPSSPLMPEASEDSVAIPVNDPHPIMAAIPAENPVCACQTLASLEEYTAAARLIDLDRTRQNPVFGVGNPNARLMVIGEAPGADEDAKGEPFVGRAGQLLKKILAAISFTRDDVYIANILKSRPPDNRTPTAEETRAHLPILYRQISLIKPEFILCLGKTAGNGLLGNTSSLKDMRSTFHPFFGIQVMVTYHPAALLRNPNWKRPTWEDVQLLRQAYDAA